jgi:phosphoglycerol transferase
LAAVVLSAIGVIGVLDQTSVSFAPSYSANAAAWRSDGDFVKRIERSTPPHAAIFQLPYAPYPEAGPINRAVDYDLMRGYLHSDSLRWSYGAMRGRPSDWSASLANMPPKVIVPLIAAAGFSGIYVDRYYFPDGAARLTRQLKHAISTGPAFSSADRRLLYFSLSPVRKRISEQCTAQERRATAAAVLHPDPAKPIRFACADKRRSAQSAASASRP